jgi:hypothetical protein
LEEVELADRFWPRGRPFDFYYDIASAHHVEHEEIDEELVPADIEAVLATYVGVAVAKLA